MPKIIRSPQLSLSLDDISQPSRVCAQQLGIPEDAILELKCIRKSLDIRHKHPKFQMIYDLAIRDDIPWNDKLTQCVAPPPLPELPHRQFKKNCTRRIALVGCGPTCLFAALALAEVGLEPHIFERGKPVRERTQDIARLLHHGILNPESNVCFGEGGAGTFSDGKLFTRTKSPYLFHILNLFHDFGAKDDILYNAKPHIGTDQLSLILPRMREYLIERGTQFHFQTYVSDLDIRDGQCHGVIVNGESLAFDDVILGCGHSESELPRKLLKRGVEIVPKSLAIGFRIEHPQALINEIQYGQYARHPILPAADYALAYNDENHKLPSVYSFCMCPGGRVIPALTQEQTAVVNGMSSSARSGKFANSAIIAQLSSELFPKGDPLGGFRYLHQLESLAARHCNNAVAPAQNLMDYLKNRISSHKLKTSYQPGVICDDFNQILPASLNAAIHKAFDVFDQKMRGFKTASANLIGIETRTSSPVQITRNRETFEAIHTSHLYPAGEGAGYAGGITSCALDGYLIACALLKKYSQAGQGSE